MSIYGNSMNLVNENSTDSPLQNKIKNLKTKLKRRHNKYVKEDIDDILDDEEDEFEE